MSILPFPECLHRLCVCDDDVAVVLVLGTLSNPLLYSWFYLCSFAVWQGSVPACWRAPKLQGVGVKSVLLCNFYITKTPIVFLDNSESDHMVETFIWSWERRKSSPREREPSHPAQRSMGWIPGPFFFPYNMLFPSGQKGNHGPVALFRPLWALSMGKILTECTELLWLELQYTNSMTRVIGHVWLVGSSVF